jgi:hypothetical protein
MGLNKNHKWEPVQGMTGVQRCIRCGGYKYKIPGNKPVFAHRGQLDTRDNKTCLGNVR